MSQNEYKWIEFYNNGLKRTKNDQNESKQMKMSPNKYKWIELDNNGSKRIKND